MLCKTILSFCTTLCQSLPLRGVRRRSYVNIPVLCIDVRTPWQITVVLWCERRLKVCVNYATGCAPLLGNFNCTLEDYSRSIAPANLQKSSILLSYHYRNIYFFPRRYCPCRLCSVIMHKSSSLSGRSAYSFHSFHSQEYILSAFSSVVQNAWCTLSFMNGVVIEVLLTRRRFLLVIMRTWLQSSNNQSVSMRN